MTGQGQRHKVYWGGHVHPTVLRINFPIHLNSIKNDGGGSFYIRIIVDYLRDHTSE